MLAWQVVHVNDTKNRPLFRGCSPSRKDTMKPRLVRCYRGFASLPGKANIEVFYTVPDFGYSNKLFTCIECGELFIIDFENPNFAGKTAEQIAATALCPKCGKRL